MYVGIGFMSKTACLNIITYKTFQVTAPFGDLWTPTATKMEDLEPPPFLRRGSPFRDAFGLLWTRNNSTQQKPLSEIWRPVLWLEINSFIVSLSLHYVALLCSLSYFLARSANLPTGLYILLGLLSFPFLPRDAMLSAVYAVVVCLCPSVCVCLSHSGIVSKRLNVGSRK